jgi:hypothetical protein
MASRSVRPEQNSIWMKSSVRAPGAPRLAWAAARPGARPAPARAGRSGVEDEDVDEVLLVAVDEVLEELELEESLESESSRTPAGGWRADRRRQAPPLWDAEADVCIQSPWGSSSGPLSAVVSVVVAEVARGRGTGVRTGVVGAGVAGDAGVLVSSSSSLSSSSASLLLLLSLPSSAPTPRTRWAVASSCASTQAW